MAQKDLTSDFTAPSKEQWLEKIKKDLRGKDFDSLISHTADGIEVQPAYTSADLKPAAQPFRENLKWDTVQEVLVEDAAQANKEARDHLNRGATAILFYMQGTEDLETLLEEIKIEFIRTHFVVAENAPGVAAKLGKLISDRGLKAMELVGSINYDPLENLARTGNWFKSEEEDFEDLKRLHENVPGLFKGLCLNVNLFGNAGATLSQQLGISLAMAYETQYRLNTASMKGFWVNFAIGSDYFGEIAKLRAFRRLWVLLEEELGYEKSQAALYCETALRNKTIKDAYNNMIRTTSESMAAVIGGASEVAVKGFNHSFEEPTAFGERIAKNQSSILKHESHLDAVKDMAQGSYFIEELTEKLAEKGWDFFKDIEAEGGYVEAMKKGWLQDKIEASAEAEQKTFDEQQKILIGANKYAKEDENLNEIIKQGMFYKETSKGTEVRPVKVRRLSEELEQD